MLTDTEVERLYLGLPFSKGEDERVTISDDHDDIEKWYLGIPFEDTVPSIPDMATFEQTGDSEVERWYLGLPFVKKTASYATLAPAQENDMLDLWFLGIPFEKRNVVADEASAQYIKLLTKPDLFADTFTTPLGKMLPFKEVV